MLFNFHVVCWSNVTKITFINTLFIKTKTKENTYKDIIHNIYVYIRGVNVNALTHAINLTFFKR